MSPKLPPWAEEVRRSFQSGSVSQFVLYGNVSDLVPASSAPPAAVPPAAVPPETDPSDAGTATPAPGPRFVNLRTFLTEVMLEPFDVVLHYDRGRGIRAAKGGDEFQSFLKAFDAFRGTSWSGIPEGEDVSPLALANLLPRDATQALELLDRFVRASRHRTLPTPDGKGRKPAPLKVAVLVDYAHFVAPQGEALHLSGERSQVLIRLLDWASDPAITGAHVATFLITESLADLNRLLVESPYSAKVQIDLPSAAEIHDYVLHLTADEVGFDPGSEDNPSAVSISEVSREELAAKLVGLSRVNVRRLVRRAIAGGERITSRYLSRVKKELIEKEAFGRIGFVESRRTLDDVAGHREAKEWLRQDAELLRRDRLAAIPMGYLLCGRIGTGKTYLVECWAGEVGVPVVELKNFRERWVGATEGNLERIFTILRALGQVVVFVDEADQMTGKRDSGSGDSGLSGRVYGMLAREMSDTANRGKIIWVFATSRPDLLEVDLKRQGRLDVHIPLFPPGDRDSRRELFTAMARKVGIGVDVDELPELPDDDQIGGNEMEGILIRALRLHETQPQTEEGAEGESRRLTLPEVIARVIADFRPSAHVERLSFMDLLAVKECTDSRFLPERYRELPLSEVNRRIEALRLAIGE